ncbi:hypothetical protein [Wolbachia endosymbiont (group A) of Barypeithes pellucidus]|uniref:hypothetical protein n=1 Tax=Wolbachia endosymbiont (group A) of Barypeithes pellucidus TaxID=3139322 RepID=UPI003CCB5C7A
MVEDNCFINRAIVTAALRNVNNPIESITNYLNEKFPANTNNIPKDFEGFVEELEKTKAQLVEKEQELTNKTVEISQLERDLKQVREERDRLSSEIRGVLNKLCQTAFLVRLNFQSARKENIKLRDS